MTLKQIILIAYIIQAFLGLHTGLYINVYVATFGQTGALFIDLDPKLIGLTWIGLLFLMEYPLELFGGAVADQLGARATFIASFVLRAFFTIGTALFIMYMPPAHLASYLFITLILSISFASAFTLLSGNFEIWLRSLCHSHEHSDVVFTYSETFFWLGLTCGGILSLLLTAKISLIISGICVLFVAVICFLIKKAELEPESRKHHEFENKKQDSSAKNKSFWRLIKEAKPLLRQEMPDVNRVFWVLAIIYGLAQIMEGFIPTYYVLSNGSKMESLIIVIGCLWLPSLIGAAYKTPFVGKLFSYFNFKENTFTNISFPIQMTSKTKSINKLHHMTLKYAFISALIPLTLLIPSTHLRLIALGLSIFLARIVYGTLRPLFKSYAASRIHETSKIVPYDVKQKLGEKTVMSIGEQRMKLGAIISILPFYLMEGFYKIGGMETHQRGDDAWPYFAAIGVTALFLALISSILLRQRSEEQ